MVEATSGRVLAAYSFSDNNMTTELCLNTCSSKGYLYAGTQYASECYCDNQLSAVAAPDSDCKMPCKGSATQMWYVFSLIFVKTSLIFAAEVLPDFLPTSPASRLVLLLLLSVGMLSVVSPTPELELSTVTLFPLQR
jgi:hypothetical protein